MDSERFQVGFVGPALAFDAVASALGSEIEAVRIDVDSAALRRAVPGLHGLVEATTRLAVGAALFDAAPRLRIVSVAGTGDAHIDRAAAKSRGITVRTLSEDRELLEALDPTAEHTWGLLLACARHLTVAAEHVTRGGWERERFPGKLLAGRRLGILGLGRLGRKVARYGAAFGMDIIAHDHTDVPVPVGVRMVDLDTLFATADFLTIHVPLDDTTRGLVDRRLIRLMRPGAILVNTSRGAVIDEGALADALRISAIAGAALDVLTDEPPAVDNPLIELAQRDQRLLITPHLGGYVPDILRTVCAHAAAKVRIHLLGATQ